MKHKRSINFMFIKNFLNVCTLSLLFSLPLSNIQAEVIDVQATIIKAQKNDKQGLYQLAYLKQMGQHGVEKNIPEAIELYKRASALGHRSANHNLGLIYYKGEGVPIDYVESAKWLAIASQRNLEDSQRVLLSMYYKELIPKNLTEMEKLHLQLAEKEEQREIESLADFYYFDKKDMELAVKPTLLLAQQGIAEYQFRLGSIYSKSVNGKSNYDKAFPWFLKAAEAGNLSAKLLLVTLYKYGLGVKQDHEKAIEWLNSAFSQSPEETCNIITDVISENNNNKNQCDLSTR